MANWRAGEPHTFNNSTYFVATAMATSNEYVVHSTAACTRGPISCHASPLMRARAKPYRTKTMTIIIIYMKNFARCAGCLGLHMSTETKRRNMRCIWVHRAKKKNHAKCVLFVFLFFLFSFASFCFFLFLSKHFEKTSQRIILIGAFCWMCERVLLHCSSSRRQRRRRCHRRSHSIISHAESFDAFSPLVCAAAA